MNYRADIDGLRSIAVISVVVYHMWNIILPGGYLGVDVFFVISGFVVCASLHNLSNERLPQYIARFYARRLARIIPAVVFMLVCASLLATLFIPASWLSSLNDRTALSSFYGLSNWIIQTNNESYFAPRIDFNPYMHTWSLGVEEQFYLIFPILVFFLMFPALKKQRQSMVLFSFFVLLAGTSLILCIYASTTWPELAFYSIATRFWELAAGALLFFFTTHGLLPVFGKSLFRRFGCIAGMCCLAAALVFADASQTPYYWTLLAVVGSLLAIGGVHADTTAPGRPWLASNVPVWIGKRSYSIYLWHWPLLVLLRWTTGLDSPIIISTAIVAILLMSSFSYRFVEMPLRHNKRIQQFPISAQIAIFIGIAVAGYITSSSMFAYKKEISLSTVVNHFELWSPASRIPSFTEGSFTTVTSSFPLSSDGFTVVKAQEEEHPQKTLFIAGDSHTNAYIPVVKAYCSHTGNNVVIFKAPGCSFLDMKGLMDDQQESCGQYWLDALRFIYQNANPGDILFLSSLRLPRLCDQWDSFGLNDVNAFRNEYALQRITLAAEEAVMVLQPLATKGVDIVFEAPKPVFPSPPFRCSDWFNKDNPICQGGLSISREYIDTLRAPVMDALHEVIRQVPAVRIFDPLPILCPGEECSALSEGKPLFFDGDHISANGNELLFPYFMQAMEGIGSLETPATQ